MAIKLSANEWVCVCFLSSNLLDTNLGCLFQFGGWSRIVSRSWARRHHAWHTFLLFTRCCQWGSIARHSRHIICFHSCVCRVPTRCSPCHSSWVTLLPHTCRGTTACQTLAARAFARGLRGRHEEVGHRGHCALVLAHMCRWPLSCTLLLLLLLLIYLNLLSMNFSVKGLHELTTLRLEDNGFEVI